MSGMYHVFAYWRSGGYLLAPLGVVCFGILLLVIRTQALARRLLREGSELQAWLQDCRESMDAAMLQACLPRSAFAAVFHSALAAIRHAGQHPLDACLASENVALRLLRRDMILLVALTAAAPLLGLLGTVGGMIATFEAVSVVSGQTGSRVAGGISQALITTQFGLVIAMPGVFGLAHLRQLTRDVQLMLGDCRAHTVALLADHPRAGLARGAA